MKKMRVILVLLGLIFLITPIYTELEYPIIKVTTESAVHTIESEFVDLESMTKDQEKQYQFYKGWIISNNKGLRNSAKIRQYAVTFIGLSSALVCFLGAIFLPRLIRRSNRNNTA